MVIPSEIFERVQRLLVIHSQSKNKPHELRECSSLQIPLPKLPSTPPPAQDTLPHSRDDRDSNLRIYIFSALPGTSPQKNPRTQNPYAALQFSVRQLGLIHPLHMSVVHVSGTLLLGPVCTPLRPPPNCSIMLSVSQGVSDFCVTEGSGPLNHLETPPSLLLHFSRPNSHLYSAPSIRLVFSSPHQIVYTCISLSSNPTYSLLSSMGRKLATLPLMSRSHFRCTRSISRWPSCRPCRCSNTP